MKKFIKRSIIFLFILFVLLHFKPIYLLIGDKYQKIVAGLEVYHSIAKSKQKKKTKKLLLGDSVTNQLLPNTEETDSITSLACNQAISLVGHYILLNNYLNAGNRPDTVYIMFLPSSFANNLDQVFSFHYFLKPFYNNEYRPLFTETVERQVHKIPLHFLISHPYVLTSNWAPDFYPEEKHDYTFLSPISVEYLHKIKELSIKNNFKLIILAPPADIINKNSINTLNKNEITRNNLSDIFSGYFENIKYMPDSLFIDGRHFKEPEKYKDLAQKLLTK